MRIAEILLRLYASSLQIVLRPAPRMRNLITPLSSEPSFRILRVMKSDQDGWPEIINGLKTTTQVGFLPALLNAEPIYDTPDS